MDSLDLYMDTLDLYLDKDRHKSPSLTAPHFAKAKSKHPLSLSHSLSLPLSLSLSPSLSLPLSLSLSLTLTLSLSLRDDPARLDGAAVPRRLPRGHVDHLGEPRGVLLHERQVQALLQLRHLLRLPQER